MKSRAGARWLTADEACPVGSVSRCSSLMMMLSAWACSMTFVHSRLLACLVVSFGLPVMLVG